MNRLKYLGLAAFAGLFLTLATPTTMQAAQVSVTVGAPPACPYGYYDYAPYNCAPYGYYGPEWFTNGVFIGVGPWFHGHEDFRGHVDNRFDVHNGYHGHTPARGERATPENRVDRQPNFHGNEMRDGRGHVSHEERR